MVEAIGTNVAIQAQSVVASEATRSVTAEQTATRPVQHRPNRPDAPARVAVSQYATPAQVEDSQRRIEALETELEILAREEAIGIDNAAREDEVCLVGSAGLGVRFSPGAVIHMHGDRENRRIAIVPLLGTVPMMHVPIDNGSFPQTQSP